MSDKSTDEHLDLEELADVLAGSTPAHEGHASGCPECAERLARLQAALDPVAVSLETLRDPEQPAELGTRLHRAITREQSLMHPTAGAAAGPRPASIAAQRAKKRTSWSALGPLLVGAAALALVGVVVFTGDDPERPQTAAAPEVQDLATHTSSSGTDYDKAGTRLQTALPALLGGAVSDSARGPVDNVDPLGRLRTTPALASCLTALTDPSDTRLPLALDYARFEGQPALAVVLASDREDKVDVFFVGAACAEADADLLHFTRLNR